ncbi:UNVERIFIED_CONTAM: hypothetical protein KB582_04770 [Streptococcus canis]|nr:hypothetical protein [Streptococcus gallolyticus]
MKKYLQKIKFIVRFKSTFFNVFSKLIGFFILFLSIPIIVLSFVNLMYAFNITVNTSQNSALAYIVSETNSQSIGQLAIGTVCILILTAFLFLIGSFLDGAINHLKQPNKITNKLIKSYLKITEIINRWYHIVALVTWSLLSLTDLYLTYFTMLISLVALLYDKSPSNRDGIIRVFPHSFLDSSFLSDND